MNSSIIQLQTLEKEYAVVLGEYQEANENFMHLLQDEKKTGIKNYSQVIGSGGICSGSSQLFPDGTWEKNTGNFPIKQCEDLCNENAYCAGYNLGSLDSNNNPQCILFSDPDSIPVNSTSGEGCFKKNNFQIPISGDSSTQQQVNTNTNNINLPTEFATLQGRNYWGTSPLKSSVVATMDDCKTMCASDLNCTGATFQGATNFCYTRSGENELTIGADTDYALIPKIRQSLLIMKNLNNKLININQQINVQMQSLIPIAKEEEANKNEKQRELNLFYEELLQQKTIIDENLIENNTFFKENENNSLVVNQQGILLKIWSLFALFLLALTLKIIFNIKGSSFIFLIITVCIIMVLLSLDWWSLIPIIILPLLFKLIYFPS